MLLSLIGTRPQFIKVFPVAIEAKRLGIKHSILDTGQHFDDVMSRKVIEFSGVTPDFTLKNDSQSASLSSMVKDISQFIESNRPIGLIVYGDTRSTLAGAIAATSNMLPVIHVESGLRSNDLSMPEERNRRAVDHLSNLLLAPTPTAFKNLRDEGLGSLSIEVGNITETALNYIKPLLEEDLGETTSNSILCTLHRASNVDEPERLQFIFDQLGRSPSKVELFAHPRLRKNLKAFQTSIPDNVDMKLPLPYVDFLKKVVNSVGVITDSGGLQNDAHNLGKLVLVVRDRTEWVENVNQGITLDPDLNSIEVFGLKQTIMENRPLDSSVASKILTVTSSFFENFPPYLQI
jgi:UDP-N-acetylglucosamine 2-epimerase